MALYPCTNNEIDLLISGSITSLTSYANFIRQYGVFSCTNLVEVSLPNVARLYDNAFAYCSALPLIDLPKVASINRRAFIYCSSLAEVVLRNDTMVSLTNTDAFDGTPFGENGTGGKLYVPQSLITTYQANANWSTILGQNPDNQILAIEGSPYEN